jgi:hypothetical protein
VSVSQRAAIPPLAPGRDGTVYLVLDSQADLQTVVANLLSGQYRYPLRVVAFDTVEGWMRDVTRNRAPLSCAVELHCELPAAVFGGASVSVRTRPILSAPSEPGLRVWPVHPPVGSEIICHLMESRYP